MFDSVTLALLVGILIGGVAGYLLCLAVNSGKVEVVDKPRFQPGKERLDEICKKSADILADPNMKHNFEYGDKDEVLDILQSRKEVMKPINEHLRSR